ncbi:DUF2252 domain-containing protein [Burkholderia arboris]|nr:DUF2252 domain-containing protein [Burkholderia arboris]
MARSARAYVRGNTVRFHAWPESLERRTLPEEPPVRIAGNCHVGNPGPSRTLRGTSTVGDRGRRPRGSSPAFSREGWFSGDVLRTARATR